MLTKKWLDPRRVDFTDAMNPTNGRGWGPEPSRNPFMYGTLNDPIWQAIRNGQNLEPRVLVVPDPIDQTIAAGATYTTSLGIEPNTWVYGVNCWIAPPGPPTNDFYVQVTDAVTGATLFSQQPHASNLAAASGATPLTNKLVFYLSAPRLFVPPSYPIVSIVNLSQSNVKCNFNLFCAVEIPF